MFNAVEQSVTNPVVIQHDQATPAATWVIDGAGLLAFGGNARNIDALVMRSRIKDGADVTRYEMPYAFTAQGVSRDKVHLGWPEPMSGKVSVTVRMDN